MPVAALAPGSISLRLYPHNELEATAIVTRMREEAARAAEVGFDGVMTSEHHGGFGGYLPNPLQMAGWLLEAMPQGWAAACPILLPLRPPALVAEEVAWLAARFPGRVGLGVGSGSLVEDFEIMDLTKDDLTARFARGLEMVAGMLSGRDPGRLAGDRAVARCGQDPVPVVSAAMGLTAVRRAAALGVGLILDSLGSAERCRRLIDAYREAGGQGAAILIRRVWVGPVPEERFERQLDVYRGYAPTAAQSHWEADELIRGSEAGAVAEQLAAAMAACGADALNLRIHVPGLSPEDIASQIGLLGPVVSELRRGGLGRSGPA